MIKNNLYELRKAIAKTPVSIGVAASSPVFKFYKSGVINTAECGNKVNHAVLAVGYSE